jgi:hypothetical protein
MRLTRAQSTRFPSIMVVPNVDAGSREVEDGKKSQRR